jgi:pSer/pThr/pTyr-binding forkhead associated (FHA) protein
MPARHAAGWYEMGNPHKQGRGVRFRRAQVGLGNRRKTGARPHQSSQEEQVTDKDNDQVSEDVTVETTSVFRADFLNELDAPAQAGTETAVSGVEGLPHGSALLVVKRGPNAGSRFLLDQAVTSAGRHPDSDIFLDDVTVSRRHAEFRLENAEFQVVDVGSLNGTYVNREPVDSAVLANGDEVQIGKFRLVFLTGPRGDDGESGSG